MGLTPPPLPGAVAVAGARAGRAERRAPLSPPRSPSARRCRRRPPARARTRRSSGRRLVARAGSPVRPERPSRRPRPLTLFGGDEVDSLLSTVRGVERRREADAHGPQGHRRPRSRRRLRPTRRRSPSSRRTSVRTYRSAERSQTDGDSVDALLALADSSGPLARAAAAARLRREATTPRAASRRRLGLAAASALAPPSPLVPMTPRAAAPRARRVPAPHPQPPPPADGRAQAPVTPRATGASAAGASSRPTPVARDEGASRRRRPRPRPRRRSKTAGRGRRKTTGASVSLARRAPASRCSSSRSSSSSPAASRCGCSSPRSSPERRSPCRPHRRAPARVVPPAPRCKVALVVSDVPANAEILLRMGQAPLDVERMPVGTRLEFVATAEGYAPRRAVIKAESPWDKAADGKPRIDVPIQLDPDEGEGRARSIRWPVAEPGSQVGGSGSPGTRPRRVERARRRGLAPRGPRSRGPHRAAPLRRRHRRAARGPARSCASACTSARRKSRPRPPDPQGNRVVSVSAQVTRAGDSHRRVTACARRFILWPCTRKRSRSSRPWSPSLGPTATSPTRRRRCSTLSSTPTRRRTTRRSVSRSTRRRSGRSTTSTCRISPRAIVACSSSTRCSSSFADGEQHPAESKLIAELADEAAHPRRTRRRRVITEAEARAKKNLKLLG